MGYIPRTKTMEIIKIISGSELDEMINKTLEGKAVVKDSMQIESWRINNENDATLVDGAISLREINSINPEIYGDRQEYNFEVNTGTKQGQPVFDSFEIVIR